MVAHSRDCEARSAAKAAGVSRYFTGNPCPKGHVSGRYVTTGSCVECLKLRSKNRTPEQKERAKILRAEKVALLPPKPPKLLTERQKAQLSGAITFTGKVCTACSGYLRYTSNSQCVRCSIELQKDPARKESKRQWWIRNLDRIAKERAEAYARSDKLAAAIKSKRWAAANPEKRRIVSMNYKVRRRGWESVDSDSAVTISAWLKATIKVCYWCDSACDTSFHIDHYEPLSKGGKHRVSNFVISCGPCNLKKNSKDPYLFAQSMGRLF